MTMTNIVLKTMLSPISMLQWFLDNTMTEIVKIYSDSLAVSGWFSIMMHKIVRFLVYLEQPIIMLRTCLIPLQSSRPLPPISSTLVTISATQLANDIRQRKIKCEDAMAAYIHRIKQVNPIINCLVQDRFQEALKEAKVVDELLTARPNVDYWKKNKPLLGVPLSVKESISVKGMSNNAARTHIRENVAKEDAEVVTLLKRAGAIVMVVTSTPEMCVNWETHNTYQGTSRNPYDTRRTPGGSSGGEAGLISAGGSVIGLGSDLAGSLRIPAFFTGLFSHKPTPGFIPYGGHVPYAVDTTYPGIWESLFTVGPMARYAQDLHLMLSNMVPEKNNPHLLALDQPVDFKKVKLYYIDELSSDWSMEDPIGVDMRTILTRLLHYFKIAYNVNVEKIKLKECSDVLPLAASIMLQINLVDSIYQKEKSPVGVWKSVPGTMLKSLMSDKPASFLNIAYGPLTYLLKKIPENTFHKLMAKRDRIREQIEDCLGSDGVLLVPTFPWPAPYHRRVGYQWFNAAYTTLFNITGLPVTQCPLGLTKEGLPIGIQVVGSKKQDRLCLAAARVIQSAFGGWVPPPGSQCS